MKVRIVLVEPHEAGNVGAAARAMKNFGFTDLAIAGEREARVDDVSDWWAKGAEDVVHAATRYESLEDALADSHLTVATTAVRARNVLEQLTPREVARLAGETLADEHRLTLVFGREEWGLRSEEIALCQRVASIPTSPSFPTMNLAQSVTIFCYELSKGLRPSLGEKHPAPADLMLYLHRHARRLLLEIGFLQDHTADKVYGELQFLLNRTNLSMREASVLLSLIREIEKKLGLEPSGGP